MNSAWFKDERVKTIDKKKKNYGKYSSHQKYFLPFINILKPQGVERNSITVRGLTQALTRNLY